MRRKLTIKNKKKLSQRRIQAIKLSVPCNLMMTAKLKLLVNYYRYVKQGLSATAQQQRYMEISFNKSFNEKHILTAVYQDLQRWRSELKDAPSERLKSDLAQSLSRLFPSIVLAHELKNINLGTTLCDDIRYTTGDYSLNRIAHPPYERPMTSTYSGDDMTPEELSELWQSFFS